MGTSVAGVGGRQDLGQGVGRGGGYPENCTPAKFSRGTPRDPRLDELARLGLRREWLAVAEAIGVDAFLMAWRVLDNPNTPCDEAGTLTITLRRYRVWLRHQRNQHIRSLRASGLKPSEILARLRENYGEAITASALRKIP